MYLQLINLAANLRSSAAHTFGVMVIKNDDQMPLTDHTQKIFWSNCHFFEFRKTQYCKGLQ